MIDTTPTSEQRNGLYDRYPGAEPFRDNDVDRHLFFGRPHEIDHLQHRVRAVRLLILYGKSGLGKSSLLQAGLYPRLRERAFLPIPVRLNTPQSDPVQVVLAALQATCKARGVEYRPQNTSGLWEFFKSTDLWSGEVLQTPVLVFDQFEEVFTRQSGTFRTALAAQIGELASRGLPMRLHQRVKAGERWPYSDAPPDVKLILTLREEYVGALEDLAPTVPAVFEQRFRLAPLKKESARSAIVEPARLDRPNLFRTRPFRYEEDALDDMLQFLVDDQGEVEPFQLQIICRHAEQQVAKRQREEGGDIEVDPTLFGGRKAMETLVENFYRDALRKLPRWLQRWRARDLCEIGLLSPNGHRVSLDQGNIQKRFRLDSTILDRLAEARLIRQESRPGLKDFYYELSHDSVAGAVNRGRRFRIPPQARVVFLVIVGLLTFTALTLAWQTQRAADQALRARQKATEEELKAASAARLEAEAREKAQASEREAAEAARKAADAAREQAEAARREAEAQRKAALAAKQKAEAERQAAESKKQAEVTAVASQSSVRELLQKGGLREPKMVAIPGGNFRMGDLRGNGLGAQPMHVVRIRPFAMGRSEVTFDQYDQFALATSRPLPEDEGWGRGRQPVINVSWRDAKDYADWLSKQTGKRYRLPTEAEWEYAARSGAEQEVWAGTSKESTLGEYAVFVDNAGNRTAEVGTKKANEFGLSDMSGNVWEWIEDCWHENYTGAPTDGSAWLEAGGGNCGQRIIRGGSLDSKPETLRASYRSGLNADNRYSNIGFRLAQDLEL